VVPLLVKKYEVVVFDEPIQPPFMMPPAFTTLAKVVLGKTVVGDPAFVER